MKWGYKYVLFVFFIVLSCKTVQYSEVETGTFKTIIASKNFTIESDRAYPLITNAMQQVLNSGIMRPDNSAGTISLIGNTNFLTIKGDSISSHLPYFGERRMNVDFGGGDGGIALEGLMKNYTVTKGKKNTYSINFDAKSNSENFRIQITVFPNLRTEMQIIGYSRTSISYSGVLAPIVDTTNGE